MNRKADYSISREFIQIRRSKSNHTLYCNIYFVVRFRDLLDYIEQDAL